MGSFVLLVECVESQRISLLRYLKLEKYLRCWMAHWLYDLCSRGITSFTLSLAFVGP